MKKNDVIRDLVDGIVIIGLIILFNEFIVKNIVILAITLVFFCINYGIILLHERKKYGPKNFPYKPYKSKEKIWKRILTGLWAGVHYLFFIGNYDHKKYNTQVYYPETLECTFGNLSQMIVLIAYIFVAVKLSEINIYYSLIFMIIPSLINIIGIVINRKR